MGDMMSAKDNERIVREFYRASVNHEFDRAANFLSPDVVCETVPTNQTSTGIQAFREMWQNGESTFPDMTITVNNVIASGNTVVCEATCSGTQTGILHTPQGDVPPTNQRTDTRMVDIMEIRNGKIERIRTYFDTGPMLQQIRKAA
jgi:steroid delta-isomerase-like uncharacterized protein